MPPEPLSPPRLVQRLSATIADLTLGHPLRVGLDGAPGSGAVELAAALVEPLRVAGRAAVVVDTRFYLRAASVRLERGRTDPDAYFEDWLDGAALRREVLDPAGPDGSGRILPTLRDPDTDRATRADYLPLPDRAVTIVVGPLLLGRELPFDLTIHLRQSPAARARRAPAEQAWTLPAFARYDATVGPAAAADLVVLVDDPHHPALLTRSTVD